MFTYITKAIEANQEIILKLRDGSKIAGYPSWGEDRSRVRIKSPDKVVWIPLDEIEHATTILNIYEKEPTD